MSTLKQYVFSQFARPRGPLGSVAGRIMSKRGSNVDRNLWFVDRLGLETSHRVLEIGPGPGAALAATLASATSVVGLDHSTTMLGQARRRNRQAVAEGRLALIEGSTQDLPPDLGLFDRIYSMNVWQFWPDQEATLARLVEHLSPGGILAIGFQPRAPGATAADADAAGRCLRDQFVAVGLGAIESHWLELRPTPVTAATGRLMS